MNSKIVITGIEEVFPEETKEIVYKNKHIPSYKLDKKKISDDLGKRYVKKRDIGVLASVIASNNLLKKIILNDEEKENTGVILGNTYGGWGYVEDQLIDLYNTDDLNAINPYVATAWFPTAAQGEISILHSLLGYSKTICAGELSSGIAIKHAVKSLNQKKVDYVISGGLEAINNKLMYRVLNKSEIYDGSILFFMERQDVAKKNGRKPLFSIDDTFVTRSEEELKNHIALHSTEIDSFAVFGNISNETKELLRDKELVVFENELVSMYSLKVAHILYKTQKKLASTQKKVLLIFEDNNQYLLLQIEVS